MPHGCKAGKRALFRPSHNWQVCSAVRAKFRAGVFPLCTYSPAQSQHGVSPRVMGQEESTMGLQGPSNSCQTPAECHKVPTPELDGTLRSSTSTSATHIGGK